MPNQYDFQRIKEHIIEPIQRHWSGEFDAQMIADYVDDLCGFSTEVMKKSMLALRRDQKRRPNLATIYSTCRSQVVSHEPPKQKKSERAHCTHAELDHPQVVLEIMESESGRLALELGCSRDLIMDYERTGKRDFTIEEVREKNSFVKKAAEALSEALRTKNICAPALLSLYDAIQHREKCLYEKYYRKAG